MRVRIRHCKRKGRHGYQRATDPRTIHIYLRPKRNSRIYFTYALLPPYFQLYGHGPRKDRSGCVRMHSVSTESRVDQRAKFREFCRATPNANLPFGLSYALLLIRKPSGNN